MNGMAEREQVRRTRPAVENEELSRHSYDTITKISQGLSSNEVFRNWWMARFWSRETRAEGNQIYRGNYFEQDENYGYYVDSRKSLGPHTYWSLHLRKYDLHEVDTSYQPKKIASANIGTNYIEDDTDRLVEYKGGFVTVEINVEGEEKPVFDSQEAYAKVTELFGDIFLPPHK